MFSGNIFCCDRYLVSDSSDAGRNADERKLWVKFVNHNYIYILCTGFFIWTGFVKLMGLQVMFFQSTYIWLIQTKLVLNNNRPTKFHQSHSAVKEMKHSNRWTLHAHYTFFSWASIEHNSEIMYKIEVIQN